MRNSKRLLAGLFILVLGAACCAAPAAVKLAERPVADVYSAQGRSRQPESIGQGDPGGLLDINEADIYDLQQLPGIGETISSLIIDERELNGPFSYPEDLLSVRGIGEKKLEQIRPFLYFHTDESGN